MVEIKTSELTLSIHADFSVRDFPCWFEIFFHEQIRGIECHSEYFSVMPIEQLQITYIKLWSVIESFSKIIKILAEKRNFLKELTPEIKRVEGIQTKLEQYKNDVLAAISFYQQSIDANSESNSRSLTAIAAVTINFKRYEMKQFAVEKSVVFKEKLPNKAEMNKALSTLKLNIAGFSDLLNEGGRASSYYQTRNQIAHEGKSDISATTLIDKRIMPLLAVIKQIKHCLEQPSQAKEPMPAFNTQPDLKDEVAQ